MTNIPSMTTWYGGYTHTAITQDPVVHSTDQCIDPVCTTLHQASESLNDPS